MSHLLHQIAGRYEVIRSLGEGASGATSLARDKMDKDRLVTVKVMSTEKAPHARETFRRECEILKKLDHPHLSRLLSFGEEKNRFFYVTEYVEGNDFVSEARNRDWNAVFTLIVQAAWGLDFLHTHHLIHRDIKSHNILVGKIHGAGVSKLQEHLHLKIIDFGLAVKAGEALQHLKTAGTLATMAPEVLAGKPYDHRADLYSFGIVLYETALGKLPVEKAQRFSDTLQQIREGKIDLQPLKEWETPAGVIELIRRLTKKDPDQRPSSAKEIIEVLNEIEKEKFPLMPAPLTGSIITKPSRSEQKSKSQILASDSPSEIVKELLSLSRAGKKTEAWEFAEPHLHQIGRWRKPSLVEDFFALAIHLLIERGRYDEAERQWQAMKAHTLLKDRPVLETHLMGSVLALKKGDLKKANHFLKEIPPALLSASPPDKKARYENYAGLVRQAEKNFSEAAAHFERGAGFARESGRKDQQASLLTNAGALLHQQGDWAKAFALFQKALPLAREIENDLLLATLLNNLGNLYLTFGRFSEAGECLLESLEWSRRQDLKPLIAYNLYLMTVVEEGRGNPERVESFLKEALSFAQTLGDTVPLLQSLLAKGYGELTRNDFETGIKTANDLKRRSEKAHQEDFCLQADWLRAKLLIHQGRFENPELAACLKAVKEDALQRDSQTTLWQVLSDEGDTAKGLRNFEKAKTCYEEAMNRIDTLKKQIPQEFQESFLRDRKKEKIRKALESIAPVSPARNFKEEAPLSFQFENSSPPQKEVPMTLEPNPPKAQQEISSAPSFQKWTSLNRRLLSQQKIEDLLEEILDAAIELTDAERGFVIYSETGELKIEAARNIEKESLKKEEEVFSATIAQEVMRKGESQIILDAQTDEKFSLARSVQALQIRSVLCVPLKVGHRTVGLIYLDNRFRQGVFQGLHGPLTQALADQASLALEHTRLHRENQEKIEELKKSKALIEKLNANLEKALGETEANLEAVKEGLKRQNEEIALSYRYDKIIGASSAIRQVLKTLDRIVPTDMNVYIYGESGAGKELIAQAVHFNGPRKDYPFISENCSALSETLLESELFGHVKGAFTGADRNKIGLFEMAHNGTLFLDEVGDMSPAMQAKLLRVLQEGEVRPVGGKDYRKVNVRLVSASNKDLSEMVKQGAFRKDLYFRLNVVRINLPPLRDRREDIPLLLDHFLNEEAEKSSSKKMKISKGALKALMNYDWPGNIRELQNEIQRLMALTAGSEITTEFLSPPILEALSSTSSGSLRNGLDSTLAELEKKVIAQAMAQAAGNKVKAAQILKVSRRTLYAKLDLYRIDPKFGKISKVLSTS